MKSLPLVILSVLAASAAFAAPPEVTMTDQGATVLLENGVVSATIDKATAHVSSLKYRETEMTRAREGIYYSMDGGPDYERPKDCLFAVKTQSPDLVDIGMRRVYKAQPHVFDIEIHFVLKRGDSGLYTYALLDHPATYPAARVGEWRVVWKLPDDLLERICVDDERAWPMPAAADFAKAQKTAIKEIVKLTSGPLAGRYDCKYAFNANYWSLGCWGHASDRRRLGAWAVFGSHEFFNDGPTKQDLTSAYGLIHVHFGLDHYNASVTSVAAGEAWRKIYGPLLLYCNTGADSAVCWADARARSAQDEAAWPFAWLGENAEYPLAAGRGTVSGRFIVKDALKPAVTSAGAWIGLAQPEPGGNWQFESKHYQYWVHAERDGAFTIPHVRPGTYTFSAFTEGAVREFTRPDVTVTAAKTTSLGDVTWSVPHHGARIAWEIGVPDRTAREFRHGHDYFEPYLWERLSNDLPNPLEYIVGKSDPAKDWNYAQCGYLKDGVRSSWPWRIHFDLAALPATGDATLTLALASAERSHIDVFVNDEKKPHASVNPAISGGNALLREGIHAKYDVEEVAIPVAKLHSGANTITLVQQRGDSPANHIMYDYLSLELPAAQ